MGYSSSGNGSLDNFMTNSSEIPKFKSLPPPSLPLSPPPFSPSSYFAIPAGLSPAELLDSPILLSSSNLLPSPTTGAFAAHAFSWNPNSNNNNKSSDFIFQTRSNDFTTTTQFQPSFIADQQLQQPSWNFQDQTHHHEDPSLLKDLVKSEFPTSQHNITKHEPDQNLPFQPAQYIREQRKSEDGYNWRKYGQKQVKGSENPRSYYKCTYPNCPMKKKIEKSLDGQITEIVYKGNHNHPKPVNARRSSSSASTVFHHDLQGSSSAPQRSSSGQMNSASTPVTSSISLIDDEHDMSSSLNRSAGDEVDDVQPEAKRWKGEAENECVSAEPGSRTVREPRVVVQTTTDIDILDDGYRWRKYGQKVVKGNPNPRSYYKCTHPGCPVRKHVERAAQDMRAVITTYEGKHNHQVPAARGSGMNRQTATSMSGSAAAYVSGSTGHMLQNPGNFGFSAFLNHPQYTDNLFSNNRAKEEPKDDLFFDSMLR